MLILGSCRTRSWANVDSGGIESLAQQEHEAEREQD